MGRKGSGVERRDSSIRIAFVLAPGERPVRRTLMIAGKTAAPTAANLKYAHRLAAEIRERIRLGTFSMAEYFPASGAPADSLLLSTRLDIWLDAQRVEPSTLKGYRSAVNFWKQAKYEDSDSVLGDKHVRALLHSDILTALAKRPDLKGKTVKNYSAVLHQTLTLAVHDKLITENPADDMPTVKVQKDPPDPFKPEEAERIIAYAAKHYPEPVYNMIEHWFFTGVRTSEQAGLRWSSVDLASGYMVVKEAIVLKLDKDTTKTSVERNVMLNSRALAALQRQRKHTQMAGEHVWKDPRYDREWRDEQVFRKTYWRPMMKVLGIRYRPPYHMRHTFATMMLMAGRTPAWCARQLGHSVEVFHRTYAVWLDGVQDDRELAGFETWLANSSPIPPQSYTK
jgi:integrase